jgi:hypothetical protein
MGSTIRKCGKLEGEPCTCSSRLHNKIQISDFSIFYFFLVTVFFLWVGSTHVAQRARGRRRGASSDRAHSDQRVFIKVVA